jgi:hypothetical protein
MCGVRRFVSYQTLINEPLASGVVSNVEEIEARIKLEVYHKSS